MKQKIMDALKQKYVHLGVGDEVFERVAESVQTFITDENLSSFVAGAEGMLKQYQSTGDKARTERDAAKREVDELKAKVAALEGKTPPPATEKPEDFAAIIEAAVTKATSPLQAKLDALEHANSSKEAVNNAKSTFFANDYVKKYKNEGDDAWERANEMNEATGSKMTAEELQSKALSYFNKTVARLGVDTSKPFEAQSGEQEEVTDWSAEVARKKAQGLIS